MHEWKQAWNLSKIELGRQVIRYVFSAILFLLLAGLLGVAFGSYIDEHPLFKENNPGLYDIAFILLFGIVPSWMRAKDFRYQKLSSDFRGSPYFMKLLELPIPEKVIIKSRFLAYLAQSVPFHVLFLVFFYFVTLLTGDNMSPIPYAAFSIIWLSFGIYAGHVFPASDAGDRTSPVKMVFLSILWGALGLGTYFFISFVSPHGLVTWTVLFATEWPLVSSILSILLVFVGIRFWMYHMKKRMSKQDYL